MAYYPKSQIKTDLYTNGNQYILANTKKEYKGYYYATSDGSKYTGKNPQDGPNTRLLPIPDTFDKPLDDIQENISNQTSSPFIPPIISRIVEVDEINPLAINYNPPTSINRLLPPYNLTLPTDQDKSLGVFSRYFCKKTNELIYLETDKKTYDELKNRDTKIAWDLYEPLTTLWYIKGDKETTYKANKGLVSVIEQRQQWYGFSKYLKEDFLKYYVGE